MVLRHLLDLLSGGVSLSQLLLFLCIILVRPLGGGTEMTIKITDLLDLLAYAGQLDLSIFVREDEDGYYVLKFYELYTNDFDGSVVITEEGESDWNKGTHSFDSMMDTFVDMLSNKKEEKLKAQKRQEVLARLTNEEKELLGVK